VNIASNSTLSKIISAADVAAKIGSAFGADIVFDTVVEQAAELLVEFDESIVDADVVLAAVQTVACASTTSTSCVAAFTVQRRRALAQTAAKITIRRALASIELIRGVPSLSAADLAAALNVDVSAIGGVLREAAPPAIKSFRISVALGTVGDQDEVRLLQAIAIIFGVDSSTLSVTAISLFPPGPPSPVAPSELEALSAAPNLTTAWLFVGLGVAAALLAALAGGRWCHKRRRSKIQPRNRPSSSVNPEVQPSTGPSSSADPGLEALFTPEVPNLEVASVGSNPFPEVPVLEVASTTVGPNPFPELLSSRLAAVFNPGVTLPPATDT